MERGARQRWLLAWCAAICSVACASNPSTGDLGSAGTSANGDAGTGGAAGSATSSGGATSGAGTTSSGVSGSSGAGGNTAGGSAAGGSTGGDSAAGAAAGLDCTDRLVCDDFETGAVVGGKPQALWKLRQTKGTVTLDDTRAVSGKYSVKVSIAATATDDTYRQALLNIDGAPLLPLANNKLYGRFMIYTERIPDQSVHWTFAHGDGPYGDSGTTATYNYGGMGNLMANYYRDTKPDATDCWQTKDEMFPTAKWQCVGFLLDGPKNEMHFWMGPTEVNELGVLGNEKSDQTCTVPGVDGKWYAPTFKNISIGWESYQHDVAGAHDAWIDDVVLDDEAVSCP